VSVQFIPLAGCLQNALQQQSAFAASMLHLFQSSFTPDPTSPLSAYTTAEATYTTYAALPMTTWFPPILAPGSGFMIQSPEVQFTTGSSDPIVTNLIGGCYLVDSGGFLRITIIFTTPVPFQLAHQGLPINIVYLFPTGI
jgi:hypothetical protein